MSSGSPVEGGHQAAPSRGSSAGQVRGHDHGDHSHHQHAADASLPIAPDADALISGRGIWLTRAGRAILQGIDIDIRSHEIVTLIGPNGAGKTTLVRALLGLEPVDQGSVQRKPGLVVGYAPQRFEVDRAIPLTVERFVALGARATPEAIEAVLAEVGAGQLSERQLSQLSGGELQRVVLARALIRAPAAPRARRARAWRRLRGRSGALQSDRQAESRARLRRAARLA